MLSSKLNRKEIYFIYIGNCLYLTFKRCFNVTRQTHQSLSDDVSQDCNKLRAMNRLLNETLKKL